MKITIVSLNKLVLQNCRSLFLLYLVNSFLVDFYGENTLLKLITTSIFRNLHIHNININFHRNIFSTIKRGNIVIDGSTCALSINTFNLSRAKLILHVFLTYRWERHKLRTLMMICYYNFNSVIAM